MVYLLLFALRRYCWLLYALVLSCSLLYVDFSY